MRSALPRRATPTSGSLFGETGRQMGRGGDNSATVSEGNAFRSLHHMRLGDQLEILEDHQLAHDFSVFDGRCPVPAIPNRV
jgi:hypothetical protein